jgi:predicted dehydrogenase
MEEGDKMNYGLIGCGGIGWLRAQALQQIKGDYLLTVHDLDESRAYALASRYGSSVESSWGNLIKRDDVEAVIVSTPPSLHAEMAITALEAGKHVLCEKPLARTPEECRQILEAAEKSGTFLATGFNYRFYPSILKARDLFDAGLIGELDYIRSYSGYTAADHDHDWLHDYNVMGGGALRDNGIHLIDLTTYFLGDVEEVKGVASNAVWGFQGCEDNGFVLMRNTAGNIASLQASWTEWQGYKFLIEIYGTRGCILLSYDDPGGLVRCSRWQKSPPVGLFFADTTNGAPSFISLGGCSEFHQGISCFHFSCSW